MNNTTKIRPIKAIYHAILEGDSYSNEEAIVIRDHFKLTANACFELGPRFHMAFREANDQHRYLTTVCQARGIN